MPPAAAAASSSKSGPANPKSNPKLPACGFSVTGSKKGGVPVTVEKRPKGKKVTIVHNVQGSAKSLLAALSSLLGCGGTIREEAKSYFTVEIQGDQVDRVNGALTQLGCLKGVRKDPGDSDKKKRKEVEDVSNRNAGYSKFLRQGQEGASTQEKKAEEARRMEEQYLSSILPLADCYKWHGAWIYCRGRCQQVDFDDIWADGTLRGEDQCAPCESEAQAAQDHAEDLPQPPSSLAELNLMLRDLGMFPEAGAAVLADRVHANPAKGGVSLKDYRRSALAPGARLIDDEGYTDKRNLRSYRNQSDAPGAKNEVKARPRPSKPIKLPPAPKIGNFPCIICGASFSLGKTLKLHMRNSHPGEDCSTKRRVTSVPGSTNGSGMKQWYDAYDEPSVRVVGDLGRHADPKRTSNLGDWALGGVLGSAKPQKQKQSERCPICEKVFSSPEALVDHVEAAHPDAAGEDTSNSDGDGGWEAIPEEVLMENNNNGYNEEEEEEESGDENDSRRLPPIFQVREDYNPQSEIEIAIRQGQRVAVQWRQPRRDGGYWAYGWVVPIDPPRRKGYFPIDSLGELLHKRGEGCPTTGNALVAETEPSQGVGEEDMEAAIPEHLLESFMMMDLSKTAAAAFWEEYGKKKKRMNMEKAWIAALEYVCQYLPTDANATGNAASSSCTAPLSVNEQQRLRESEREKERRERQERQDRREAEKLQAWERKQEAKRRKQQQQQEWSQWEQPQQQQQQQQQQEQQRLQQEKDKEEEADNLRKVEEYERQQQLQQEEEQRRRSQQKAAEEEEQWQERQRTRREQQQQREQQERKQQQEREEKRKREELRRQEQERLERERQAQAENRRRVEEYKRQKEQEEEEQQRQLQQQQQQQQRQQQQQQQRQQQQTAAGTAQSKQTALPAQVKAVRGCREGLTFDVGDWLSVDWVQPAEEGACWAWGRAFTGGKWSELAYFPITCLPPGLCPVESNLVGGTARQSATASAPATKPSATTATTTAATKATAAKATTATTTTTTATTAAAKTSATKVKSQEPTKTKVASKKKIEVEIPPPELVPEPGTPTAAVKVTTMSDKDEEWAISQIAKLHQKHGVGKMDPAAILAMFFTCESVLDLRFEAKVHLADNQPVRNFVENLWQRKQKSG